MPKETARQVPTRLAEEPQQHALLFPATADNSKRPELQSLCGRTAGVRWQQMSHAAF
ncbi:hypothetical protein [Pectobacterium brasiliense]|uniref:hypothetical protein n=1 Tax=Pectobacterium brasiliense TaxID=180957 RepID=UPI00065CCE30|nr:hypothetical protein [Pectobacterium brasiliense]KMK84376.1 hypothetical protein KCO_09885 [Pectobacterium brasiliense ICMP 19477]